MARGSSLKAPPPSTQPTISSYFSPPKAAAASKQRKSSPIDLTDDLNSDGSRPAKKHKVSEDADPPQTPSHSRASGVAEQWRFSPATPREPQPQRDPVEEGARRQRHEAFKRKLLRENSSFVGGRKASARDEPPRQPEDSGSDSDGEFKSILGSFKAKPVVKGRKGKSTGTAKSVAKAKDVEEVGPSGETYTPLEKQILALKEKHPGTLLMIEVGYKYRFFGDDAQIASKELGIACFMDRNFLTAFIPTPRRDVHMKKLLSQGHKVGIVQQMETAALKEISENRNAPFERKLTHLYTATTYVDELDSVDDAERYTPPPLMCLIEERRGGMGADEKVKIGMITVSPSTGDVVWDDFEDGHMRLELETRMIHIKPAELLLPEADLSKPTEKMLSYFAQSPTTGYKFRVERFRKPLSYTDAFSYVTDYFTDKTKSSRASRSFNSGELMAAVTELPTCVVVALAHAIKHLAAFGIADAFLQTKFFNKFTTRAHMLLNGNTLTNLEIYRNETDYDTKGSLIWILDRTKTKFGSRQLKNWVGRPLLDLSLLRERVEAVEEILSSTSDTLVTLRGLLRKLPDLAKGLCRIQYGKCTPQELATLVTAFHKIATAYTRFDSPASVGFKSTLLNDIVYSLPILRPVTTDLLTVFSTAKASEGRKDTMWTDAEKYPEIADFDMAIQGIEFELMEIMKSIRKAVKMPSLKWTSVAGDENLIEIKKTDYLWDKTPPNWKLVSATKSARRFHTQEVIAKIKERAQCQEALAAAAQAAYTSFLEEITQKHYAVLREAVNRLATADCLLSFALVALQQNYVRPEFTEDDTLEIVDGRHPMIEVLREDPFVPNSIFLGGEEPRNKIITGPNMGGKSSAVRMIALIAIMAQIGSYVPATSVKLGMLDGILTRMGASDELSKGRSTFMVEMSETSEILHTSTDRTLIILDELGRGTSTFDGMSIAHGVLQHLIQHTRAKTLFITHYPSVATTLERAFPREVQNVHMGFTEDMRVDGTREITFLYKLAPGLAAGSFGVECARLAGLPEEILRVATERAEGMRAEVEERSRRNKARKSLELIRKSLSTADPQTLEFLLDDLKATIPMDQTPSSFIL